MRSYAELEALKLALAIPEATTGQDARLSLALVLATSWVDHFLGLEPVEDGDLWDPDGELEVEDGVPAARVSATVAAGVRFYKSPDVPFGVAGGIGDLAVYVSRSIPEAEVILLGHREAWGIA